jgi:hypothetical protein
MDKGNAAHTHRGILFSHESHENMDEAGDHYIKLNKPGTERQAPYHPSLVESKNVDLINLSTVMATRG